MTLAQFLIQFWLFVAVLEFEKNSFILILVYAINSLNKPFIIRLLSRSRNPLTDETKTLSKFSPVIVRTHTRL